MGAGGDSGAGLGQAIGALAVLLGAAGKGGKGELKKIVELANALNLPQFDMQSLAPAQYSPGDQFMPEEYQAFLQQQNPALATEGPEGRSAQLAALRQLQGAAEGGMPLVDRLSADQAQRSVADEARRGQLSVLRDLQERGRLGGGDELAARMLGNQQSTELAATMGRDLERDSAARRLGAAQSLGQQGGALRQQDFSNSMANSNVLNRFNEFVSNLVTGARAQNAGARQQAGFANVERRHDVADENETQRYQAALENLMRQNALRQQGYNNQLSKFGAQSGAYGGLGQAKYYEQAAKAQNIQSLGQGTGRAVGGIGDIFAFGG